MNASLIKSRRLLLREFVPDDAGEMYRLNADPEVLRYTGDVPFESEQTARAFLQNYSAYRDLGYGRWAVLHRQSGQWLGFCGLSLSEEVGHTDLGFRFHREFWGRGYATEAALACLEFGFGPLGLERIVARAMHENLGSIRVLEKIGMQRVGETRCAQQPAVLFEMRKDQSFVTHGHPRQSIP